MQQAPKEIADADMRAEDDGEIASTGTTSPKSGATAGGDETAEEKTDDGGGDDARATTGGLRSSSAPQQDTSSNADADEAAALTPKPKAQSGPSDGRQGGAGRDEEDAGGSSATSNKLPWLARKEGGKKRAVRADATDDAITRGSNMTEGEEEGAGGGGEEGLALTKKDSDKEGGSETDESDKTAGRRDDAKADAAGATSTSRSPIDPWDRPMARKVDGADQGAVAAAAATRRDANKQGAKSEKLPSGAATTGQSRWFARRGEEKKRSAAAAARRDSVGNDYAIAGEKSRSRSQTSNQRPAERKKKKAGSFAEEEKVEILAVDEPRHEGTGRPNASVVAITSNGILAVKERWASRGGGIRRKVERKAKVDCPPSSGPGAAALSNRRPDDTSKNGGLMVPELVPAEEPHRPVVAANPSQGPAPEVYCAEEPFVADIAADGSGLEITRDGSDPEKGLRLDAEDPPGTEQGRRRNADQSLEDFANEATQQQQVGAFPIPGPGIDTIDTTGYNPNHQPPNDEGALGSGEVSSFPRPGAVPVPGSNAPSDEYDTSTSVSVLDRGVSPPIPEVRAGEREEPQPMVNAYLVGDIVEAQTVTLEELHGIANDGGEREKRLKTRRHGATITLLALVPLAILFVSLGMTGNLRSSSNSNEQQESQEFVNTTAPEFCFVGNCWKQLGPGLIGAGEDDRFAQRISLARDGRRIAVTADNDEGSGLVFVYDVTADVDGNLTDDTALPVGQVMSGQMPGDNAGGVLSGDGRLLAVGSPGNDGPDGELGSVGEVRVFELRDGNNWTLLGEPIYGEAANEQAGSSLTLSNDGSVLAVGLAATGRVRVYRYLSGRWEKRGQDISGEGPGDSFGGSVSLSDSGTIIAIGARYNNGDGGKRIRSGHARVYKYESGSDVWTQLGGDIDGTAEGDHFGRTVLLSADGTLVAVKASSNDADGRGPGGQQDTDDSGYVQVLSYDGGANTWRQVGDSITGVSASDYILGLALSADGKRIAVSAGSNSNVTAPDASSGYVRVFNNVDGEWHQVGGEISERSTDGVLGTAVSLSGHGGLLAVVHYMQDPVFSGIVRMYEMSWLQIAREEGQKEGDKYGSRVSLAVDGTRLAVSAPSDDFNGEEAGKTLVYNIGTDESLSVLGQSIFGSPGDEAMGRLSRDGRRLVVGGQWNIGRYGNLSKAGKVAVYEWNDFGNNWTILGEPIYGNASNDRVGKALSLSRNGSIMALSAIGKLGKGAVQIYRYVDNNSWVQLGLDIEGKRADDKFGWHLTLSDDGKTIVIGSRRALNDRGSACIHEYVSGEWKQIGPDIEGVVEKAKLGFYTAISADGSIAAIGADYISYGGYIGRSQVGVFSRDDANSSLPWRLIGTIPGKAVALSADGKRIAVAKPAGPDGWARVYDFVGGAWHKVGRTVRGVKENDNFGSDVALSTDGTRLVVGSSAVESQPELKGAVTLFDLPPVASRWK